MDAPVEDWPVCDCLVAFYSTGFPSDKAEAYVKLRRPYALNNLEMQDVLHDRRRVRKELSRDGKELERCGIHRVTAAYLLKSVSGY